jgi:hypothetical protein
MKKDIVIIFIGVTIMTFVVFGFIFLYNCFSDSLKKPDMVKTAQDMQKKDDWAYNVFLDRVNKGYVIDNLKDDVAYSNSNISFTPVGIFSDDNNPFSYGFDSLQLPFNISINITMYNEVSVNCVGNYTRKFNDTFMGCVKR